MLAPAALPLMVASIVTVTDSPGSRQDTFTVTNCPTVESEVTKAVPPLQESTPDVPCVLVTSTASTLKLESRVSVRTISKAVAALFPTAVLLKVRVYVIVSPGE